MMLESGPHSSDQGEERSMAKMRSTRAKARLRRRQAGLDRQINRSKRTIKSLSKKLKRATAILTRRQRRRAKMK
jgi:hypothetical protein